MTFREKSISKLYAFALAAVFALTLAGCGGGGGGTTDTTEPPAPMPTPQEQCVADKGAGSMLVDGTCYSAMEYASKMCVAGGGTYEDGTCTPPRDDASPKMIMAKAMGIMALDPKTDDANTAGVTETKGFGHHVLDDSDPQVYVAQKPFDAGTPNATDDTNLANAYSVDVKWADGAAMTTVTDVGADGSTDGPATGNSPDATQDDEALTAGAAPHAIDGWAGSTHTKDMEKVTVYTNIMAATPTAFADVHTLDVRADGETATTDDPNDALNIAASNIGMVKAARFTAPVNTPGTVTIPFQHAVADTNPNDDEDDSKAAAEIMGTFNGGMGTYKCVATAACSVTVNAEGVVSGVSNDNDWIFIPAENSMVPVDDADHLHFGFWVKPPAEGEDAYSIQTFANGEDSYDSTNLAATQNTLTGSAEYKGKAAGVYAQKTTFNDETGALESGHVGAFTADANLTASFGTSADVAVNDQNTIRGTISNFMDGENAIDESWEVELKRTKFDAANRQGDTTGDGAWNHTFFGPNTAADGTTAVMPSGVAGEFTGHFSNGHVAGAYGADKVPTTE